MIQDNVNSNTDWMFVTTGGNATIGESSSNILTVNGVVISSAYTISSLPTCNSTYKGSRATVTNGAASPSFLGTVSTTGSTIAPVFCNGSTGYTEDDNGDPPLIAQKAALNVTSDHITATASFIAGCSRRERDPQGGWRGWAG